jgi:hypothetical protein
MSNKNKMVITSLSADQSDENGVITGVFVLNQYAVSGEGRELEPAKIPSMDHGVDNMCKKGCNQKGFKRFYRISL